MKNIKTLIAIFLAVIMCISCCTLFAFAENEECSHSNINVVGKIDSTCTSIGSTGDKVCQDCGQIIQKGDVIAKKAHIDADKDSICDICSENILDSFEGGCGGIAHQDNVFGRLLRFIYRAAWGLFRLDVRCCSGIPLGYV